MSTHTQTVDSGEERALLGSGTHAAYDSIENRENIAISSHEAERGTFKRNLGTLEAFAIIISIVIGSGIFTSPGSIDANVTSPGIALVIWLIGGILAWTGSVTLAELGTAIPGEGQS
jgi:L-type amino acid transporter 9